MLAHDIQNCIRQERVSDTTYLISEFLLKGICLLIASLPPTVVNILTKEISVALYHMGALCQRSEGIKHHRLLAHDG